MPTSATTTYSADRLVPVYNAEDAVRIPVKLVASVALAKGTILGEVTATPGTFKAYASGAADGSQVPKCILEYASASDASQNITLGTTATGGPFGETRLVTSAYFSGAFKTAELVGLDANAVTVLGAHLISGTVADGVLQIG